VFIRKLLHYMVIRDIFLILSIIYGIIISLGEIPVFISLGIYAIIIFILPCSKKN
jgi:hypothetical protein